LFIETGEEVLPISRKLTIDDFIAKISDGKSVSEVRQEHLFGFLNSVYLLSVRLENTWMKYVIKTFLDWSGYKWFPLAIWTLGVQDFAVAGKKRMANEYAISRLLKREGFNVPDIYDISWRNRLIFEKFIEGETLDETVSNALVQGFSKAQMGILHLAGETVGRVHKLNLCLGDCKPENMICSKDGGMYLIDLEQARTEGNPAWDVAEFLYFSTLFTPNPKREAVRELAVNFLRGYLESYDSIEHLIEAGDQKYYSVFAPFEPIWILHELSGICQDPLEESLDEFYVKTREPTSQV
jgi:tRNA A-37 threonylcarbamoyl transferase component Bud32